ncbi:hypothetical protein [Neobacillus citreus]|uniref:Uncharacterized protein n=1 Tax=Neobacillus citreus TaxID=2833578 RepID=A0A942T5C8_9BACI|nr:hypothetical protein [Neobacillus citreus]MCH6268096.1 hypothetical protein [Neobacillus citreus]
MSTIWGMLSYIIVVDNKDKEKEKVIDILKRFPEGPDAVVIGSIIGKQIGTAPTRNTIRFKMRNE